MANWANIGIGLSSAMHGFKEGQELGQNIKDIRTEHRMKGIREQGMETARNQREQDIQGSIRTLDSGLFEVGGKTHADIDSARKAAEADADDVLDYYAKTVAPQMRDAWMAEGNEEKASAYEKWMEDAEVKRGMKHWANGMRAFARGDADGAARSLMRAWNTPGYGRGGIKSTKAIKDGDTLVGIEVTMDDGSVQTIDDEAALRSGILSLGPDQMFSSLYAEQKAADQARVKIAAEARKQGLTHERQVALEGMKQEGRERLAGIQFSNAADLTRLRVGLESAAKRAAAAGGGNSPILRDYNATVQVLMQGGKPEPEARRLASERVIYRLSQSPQDRVRETMADLAKTDLRFSKLPEAEQVAKVRAVMEAEDALVQELTGAPAGVGAAPMPGAAAPAMDGGLDWYEDEEEDEDE